MHFFHLEFRNAVSQKSANTICALQHHHVMTCTCELLCNSKTSRTTANHCNTLAGLDGWNLRNNPSFTEGVINDLNFDLLNRNRVLVHTENTCRFTWSWTQTTSELREIVRGMQTLDCLLPMSAIHQVIPIRNEVAKWAAVIAERNTAVHATARLMIQLARIEWLVDLFPVFETQRNRASCWARAAPL